MEVDVFIEAPFPDAIYDISEANIFAFGLFLWAAERLQMVMSDRYGTVRADVVSLRPKGIEQHYITLSFLRVDLSKVDSQIARRFKEEIYEESIDLLEGIVSSAHLSEYLNFYNRNKREILLKASTIFKAQSD